MTVQSSGSNMARDILLEVFGKLLDPRQGEALTMNLWGALQTTVAEEASSLDRSARETMRSVAPAFPEHSQDMNFIDIGPSQRHSMVGEIDGVSRGSHQESAQHLPPCYDRLRKGDLNTT